MPPPHFKASSSFFCRDVFDSKGIMHSQHLACIRQIKKAPAEDRRLVSKLRLLLLLGNDDKERAAVTPDPQREALALNPLKCGLVFLDIADIDAIHLHDDIAFLENGISRSAVFHISDQHALHPFRQFQIGTHFS